VCFQAGVYYQADLCVYVFDGLFAYAFEFEAGADFGLATTNIGFYVRNVQEHISHQKDLLSKQSQKQLSVPG
jgi:hypothetical protein